MDTKLIPASCYHENTCYRLCCTQTLEQQEGKITSSVNSDLAQEVTAIQLTSRENSNPVIHSMTTGQLSWREVSTHTPVNSLYTHLHEGVATENLHQRKADQEEYSMQPYWEEKFYWELWNM